MVKALPSIFTSIASKSSAVKSPSPNKSNASDSAPVKSSTASEFSFVAVIAVVVADAGGGLDDNKSCS